ncbi:MAG: ribonuclease III [Firmicutes bacterium]|nr:ribonuclease III [[Eubacterium] siraeum]MCM1487774.1 ribonuclease III [Bacillota bacterium]
MKTLTKEEARGYSPPALAFYGDCAWEILVRRSLLENGNAPSGKLHSRSVELVRASFQSEAVDILEPMLSEEEADILRRGRNADGISVPKSSNPKDYHRATGLEALFGYLFLIGDYARAYELFEVVWNEKYKENQ